VLVSPALPDDPSPSLAPPPQPTATPIASQAVRMLQGYTGGPDTVSSSHVSSRRVVTVLVALAGCRPEVPPPRAAINEPDGPGASDVADATCAYAAGELELELEVGELRRRYLVHVGSALEQPPPVVFVWHGFGGSAEHALRSLDPARTWAHGIVVAPQGEPRTFEQFGARARPGWQVTKGELGDRDLAFFDALVEELAAKSCLDRRRTYSTGFSNGGFFTNVLACHRGDRLAAVAPTGGGGPFAPRCEGAALPVLVTHGRNDEVVDYAMAKGTFAAWAEHNGCAADARPPTDGCADAPGCPKHAPVRMCSLDIGHVWPAEQSARATEFLRAFERATTTTVVE